MTCFSKSLPKSKQVLILVFSLAQIYFISHLTKWNILRSNEYANDSFSRPPTTTTTTKSIAIQTRSDHAKPNIFYYNSDNKTYSSTKKNRRKSRIIEYSSSNNNNKLAATFYPEKYYEYYKSQSEQAPFETTSCKAMNKWQTIPLLTCNILHEQSFSLDSNNNTSIEYIASGMYRDVWKVLDTNNNTSTALKTLKMNQLWLEVTYDKHTREAIAMNQMKASSYIIDIYASCGTSGVFEFVDGIDLKKRIEQTYTRMMKPMDVLDTAIDLSMALADSHVFQGDNSGDGSRLATIAHGDLKPEQYVFSETNQKYKLADFNRCSFLTRNITIRNSIQTNSSSSSSSSSQQYQKHCQMPTYTKHKSRFKAPEDYIYAPKTDKADVYVLGNIFYYILTSYYPYHNDNTGGKKAIQMILKGIRPFLSKQFTNSSEPAIRAVVKAMYKCYTFDSRARPSSVDIATYLKRQRKEIINYTKKDST